jgi:hypothetical protein
MAYQMIDGKKTWVNDPNVEKSVKKKYVEKQYPLHEIYTKDEKGLMKQMELRGSRADQVRARRELRSRLSLTGDRIILFTNGQLRKVGIDKGAS